MRQTPWWLTDDVERVMREADEQTERIIADAAARERQVLLARDGVDEAIAREREAMTQEEIERLNRHTRTRVDL